MLKWIALLTGLFAVLIGGAYAVAPTMFRSPPPPPPATEAMAQAPAETSPVAPAKETNLPGDNSQPDTKPAQAPSPQPYVIEPTAPAPPAPVVTAPAASAPPVVAAPPAAQPSPPVATAPPAAEPQTPAPAPVVAVPPPKQDAKPDGKVVPAKVLFAAEKLPTLGKAMAIGYYPRGCLQGGTALPITGPSWQVMRLSRNRNWGHPSLVRFLEKFAPAAAKATGWKGILVGDMAQPRGGPTPSGHMSHQTGLDVDIWFMPMPDHTLSTEEREKISAINLVSDDWKHINPKTWTPQHMAFIKTAALQPGVERVLVNAAIKKEMCKATAKEEWMSKVRPWYAHHDHIHVRLECPADSPNCRKQPSPPEADGCGKDLDYWFSDKVLHPPKPTAPAKPPRPITMADMPPACQSVLAAPARAQN